MIVAGMRVPLDTWLFPIYKADKLYTIIFNNDFDSIMILVQCKRKNITSPSINHNPQIKKNCIHELVGMT